MTPPETRYARSGELRIAYQTVGNGPLDLVFVSGFVSNAEVFWEMPEWAHLFSRLAAFSRLILFDKRGTGLSDRMAGVAHLEERMDDVRAVMDATGSQRAALFGVSDGGPMSLLFAATYPERVLSLALYGSYARHPTLSDENIEQHAELIDRFWGTGEYSARSFAPDQLTNPVAVRNFARRERLSATPSTAIAILRMNKDIDARHVLTAIRVPTLILHRVGDTRITVDAGRYLAANIPDAKFVELPGTSHTPWAERDIADRIVDEVEEFLTGSRSPVEVDRVLATVMFTDIVDSTRRAAELGDREWRALRERHDGAVRHQLGRFRGQEATDFSPRSMAPPGRCAVPRRFRTRCGSSGSPCAAGSIPVRSN